MRNHNYDTKQKEMILEVIKRQNKAFLVKDIYDELKGKVGLTTIYRFIEKLSEDKLVNKSASLDGKVNYEYLEKCGLENHFYLKCNRCGELIHVDCDCIDTLSNHILNEHSFTISRENVIIKGLCSKCK